MLVGQLRLLPYAIDGCMLVAWLPLLARPMFGGENGVCVNGNCSIG